MNWLLSFWVYFFDLFIVWYGFLDLFLVFFGFDGVDLVAEFGFGVCWRLVYFMDLGRTRRTTSVLTKK